jgi:hypothetical protein
VLNDVKNFSGCGREQLRPDLRYDPMILVEGLMTTAKIFSHASLLPCLNLNPGKSATNSTATFIGISCLLHQLILCEYLYIIMPCIYISITIYIVKILNLIILFYNYNNICTISIELI